MEGMIDAQGGEEMNKQRKVVITITYNEMGIIIDTKAEELVRQALKKPDQRWISEQDMTDKLTRLINEFEMIMSDIREK